jgi:hydroxymethylglutaryl-CoA lyase
MVPQMADARDVFESISKLENVTYDATVPNVKGAQRAIEAGADATVVFVAASESGNKSGVGRSTEESMVEAEEVVRLTRAAGRLAMGTVATAFGSPYGEKIGVERVAELVTRFVRAGATAIALGDTSGEANPMQVRATISRLLEEHPTLELSMHFHDTRGMAVANTVAAMESGVTNFDSAVGGIGGSPFTKDSAGNLATEELLYLCESMGIDTGIDFDLAIEAYNFLADVLQRPLPSRVGRLYRSEIEQTNA